MFTLRFEVQDINNMYFCKRCNMNVFPTRPRFNIKIFGIFTISMLIIFTTITIVSLSILSEVFLFIYIMWGFLVINPYLIYYGIQKKNCCPNCFNKTSEKNLDYQPFGNKESELFKSLIPPKKNLLKWHCPHCGNALNKGALFCGKCGKKSEIVR